MDPVSMSSSGNKRTTRWSLRLFGDFQLIHHASGEKVTLPGKRERVLLAYLALSTNCRQPRRRLVTLLWGEAADETSLENLRTCVFNLRKALGDTERRVIVSEDRDIVLDAASFEIDVLRFRQLASQADRAALEEAARLHSGDILEGLGIDNEEFESWRRAETARFRDQALDIRTRLMAQLAECGETERAIEAGTRILEIEPLHEAAVRRMMRLYDGSGRRGAAIHLYRTFAETLRRELNAQPKPETRAVFAELCRGGEELPATPVPSARPDVSQPASARSDVAALAIAVLPFVNLSSDPEQEFFSDGITEEITVTLAKVPDLRVVGRTSAFQFKGQNQDLRAIGQALSATHIIEGSVRKLGTRVRITAQLIDARNGTHLWAQNYDRDLSDVFATQEDIARAIAGALHVPLGLKQGQTLVSNRTTDLDAYQEYLRARALFRARSINDAIVVLESVVERDAKFAPAWGLLANAYVLLPLYSSTLRNGPVDQVRRAVQTDLAKGEKAAREALQLDGGSATGYAGLAFAQYARSKWLEAEDLYKKALEPDPNEPDIIHFYSLVLAETGHIGRAIALREKLRALEPFVPIYNAISAGTMQMGGNHERAIAILEPDAAGGFFRNVYLASAYAACGRFDKAADTLLLIQGNVVTRRSVEEAARLIRDPVRNRTAQQLPVLEGELGFVYAHVGAADRILDFPERQLAIGYAFGSQFGLWLPDAAPVRKTERFTNLIRKAGLIEYWRARGWPDFCHPTTGDNFVCD